MINKSELRLGNLCKDKISGEILRVTDLSDEVDHIGFYVVNRDKFPLPDGWKAEYIALNESIIERCGFEKGEIRIGLTGIFIHEFRTVMQGVFKGEFAITLLDGQTPYQINKRVKHLHELQNLIFALTGEELKINL